MTHHDDELLREALRAQAAGVTANDDLLDRIHAASSTPRSTWAARAPWLLAVAALAVVVGIAAAVLAQDDRGQTLDVIDDPSTTTFDDTTTTTIDPPLTVTRPSTAVALTVQARIVVIDTATGDVVRDLGGFDDPTDPAVAEREGGPFSITGVALHPNGQDVYFETCCEPAAGSIFRIPIDGSVPIGDGLFDAEGGAPVAYGYGIDISGDGRWLTYVHPGGVTLHDLETGDMITAPQTDDTVDFVQAAVNHDGTEVTVERALEYEEEAPAHRLLRSELITYRRVGDSLERADVQGGDIRLLPIYANGELAQVAARDGVIDANVDASGRWLLATPVDRPLRGYTQASDEQEIPGGPYLAADW